MDEGLVGGHSFGVDASLIPANANQTRGIDSKEGLPPDLTSRAVDEYLETLDDAAFGAATDAIPKYCQPACNRAPLLECAPVVGQDQAAVLTGARVLRSSNWMGLR